MTEFKNLVENFSFDHVGIAVNSIEEAMPFYKDLGFETFSTEEIKSQKVKVAFLKLKNNSNIELLEATSEDSPIAKFISKKGVGIHHICLRVSHLKDQLERLKSQGIKLIHETPIQGAHNCLVAFVHPKATGGVLLELSEPMGNGVLS